MKNFDEVDDERRLWLIQALAAGVFGAALPQAQAFDNSGHVLCA